MKNSMRSTRKAFFPNPLGLQHSPNERKLTIIDPIPSGSITCEINFHEVELANEFRGTLIVEENCMVLLCSWGKWTIFNPCSIQYPWGWTCQWNQRNPSLLWKTAWSYCVYRENGPCLTPIQYTRWLPQNLV